MKLSDGMTSFFEATGVAAYVVFFAIIVQTAQSWFTIHNAFPSPVATLILFLMAFIVSALVCGSLIFLYPAKLFLAGRKTEAWKIFFGSAAWLVVFLLTFGVLAFITI